MPADDRRYASLSEVANLVASGAVATRGDLVAETGLSRSAVAQRVGVLVAAGILTEHLAGAGAGTESATGPANGTARGARGRPPAGLGLGTGAGLVAGIDLGATHGRLALADVGGRIVAETAESLDIAAGPTAVLARAADRLDGLLAGAGEPAARLRAVTVGVPGPVEASTGTVIRPPIMPGWDGYRVPEFFAGRYAAPVLVDNDVNLAALGEHRRRRDSAHLLYVKVGTGIGCGIVSGGRLHRGASGAAGDIGHIRLPGHDDVTCRCGNTGCVEAVASGAAVAANLRAAGRSATSAADVVDLVRSGDAQARRQVRLAGQRLGEVLASLVSFHNPDTIVIGGSFAQLHEDLLADVRGVVYGRALPLATRTLAVEVSTQGARSAVEGALALAGRYVLSPAGIRRLLEAG